MPCNRFCNLFLRDATIAGATIAMTSVFLLAGAFFFQYALSMQPCVLCIYQRIPHGVAIMAGLMTIISARKGRLKTAAFIMFLACLVFLASAGLGIYHTGVEQHWWRSFLEACTAPGFDMSGDILSQIEKAKAVRCDEVPWSLFGISMAGYNALISFGLAMYSLIASIMIVRKSNGL